MANNHKPEPPALKLPAYPFIMFGVPVIIGLAVHVFWDSSFLPETVAIVSGIVLMAAGAALSFWAVWTMLRQGEHPEHTSPTRKIVDTGPFRFSRNPIYLGLVLTATGLGLGLNSIPVLVSVPAGFAVLALWVVPAEEKYLDVAMGDEYRQYRRRVRRWL